MESIMYCRNCGATISDIAEICINCGVKVPAGDRFCWSCGSATVPQQEICLKCGVLLKGKSSEDIPGVWWLLPVFLGWLGGLIAWLINKDKYPRKARKMLITGILISVGFVVLYFIFMLIPLLLIPILSSL